jgi:hypothetical protein
MDDALAVGIAESFRDLLADVADAIEREALALLHGVGKGSAIDEFHHQKRRAIVFTDIEDGNNSGMSQHAGGSRFTLKARAVLKTLLAGERRGMDGFEGDDASDYGIAGFEDAAHRAPADLGDDLISPNPFGNTHGEDCTNRQ